MLVGKPGPCRCKALLAPKHRRPPHLGLRPLEEAWCPWSVGDARHGRAGVVVRESGAQVVRWADLTRPATPGESCRPPCAHGYRNHLLDSIHW